MKKLFSLVAGLALGLSACNKTYLNPSAASAPQVLTSADGLIGVCNSLQYRWTTNATLSPLYNNVALSGLSTNELTILNVGNNEEYNVSLGGGNVNNSNAVVRNMWTQALLTRANADQVLSSVGSVTTDNGTRSGIIAYASIFRALAIGTLAQYFEQQPITTGENQVFVPRAQALASAVTQLQAAAQQLQTAPVSANFTSKIVPGLDLTNTIQALIARYSLEAGNNDAAIPAAAAVSLTARSVFNFDANTRNALNDAAFGNRNVFEPTNNNLGLPAALAPDANDQRLPFLVRANPTSTQNRGLGFYATATTPIPVYTPGEMLLIQAEAYARKNDLLNAVVFLNRVRQKTPAQDIYGVGAGLSAYTGALTQDAILTEIYRQRCIELAFQGFRLSDNRRFNRPGPGTLGTGNNERNRNFYPYPRVERENNSQTPADPTI